MVTTPPATNRADSSLTGFGKLNTSRPLMAASLPVDRSGSSFLGRLEGPFEVPDAGEVVERATDDLAGPLEHELLRLRVVRPANGPRQARLRSVRLRRTLIEVLVIPRGDDHADVAAQLAALHRHLRLRDRGARLRILGVGRDAEVGRRERRRLDDLDRKSTRLNSSH